MLHSRRVLAALSLVLAVLLAAPLSPAHAAETTDDKLDRMERELREIRKENEELKKRVENVEADGEETKYNFGLLSKMVDVSGYADVEFRHTDEQGESDGFRVRHLSLFFTKDIQPEWKLFTEIEYEDAPLIESEHTTDDADKVQGKVFVEQMYIEYHPSLTLDVRLGRFLTPAGIWNIYHYYPYVPTQTRPLMVRKVFPQVSDGVQVRKSFQLGGSMLDAHLYVANGAGNPGRLDRNEQKAVGARLNFSPDLLSGVSVGGSAYRERDNSDVVRTTLGAHLHVTFHDLELQGEYAWRDNDPETGAEFNDTGFYAQLAWDIGDWTLAARYDWYDPNDTSPEADMFRYTAALNYHFAHNVVGKAEYNRNEFDDPATADFNEVILAIVVAIGDL